MGMKHGSTICSKHDEITELASEIQSLCQDDINPSDLSGLFSVIQDKADKIGQLAADAKDDGQSMEFGLDEKKTIIQELKKEKEELEEQVRELEKEKDRLEDKIDSLIE